MVVVAKWEVEELERWVVEAERGGLAMAAVRSS